MIEVSHLTLAGIPCHLLRETRYGCSPLLLHYHAWGDHKGNLLNPDLTLIQAASEGFAVIAPDCHEHGERQSPAQFQKTMNGWAFLCESMEQTRKEAGRLLDAIFNLKYIAVEHGIVSGVSMGALIAQMVFADDQRLGSLISVVGRSSFLQVDSWCDRAQQGTWSRKWCMEHATQTHFKKLADRPVLFIDGGKDRLCPPAINEKTVRLINRAGGNARQVVDRKSDHGFSLPMRCTFIDWIRLHGGIPSHAARTQFAEKTVKRRMGGSPRRTARVKHR